MLDKCSNPACSAPFRYLRRGTLYRLEADPKLCKVKPGGPEYFWLCDDCTSRMSLRINHQGKLTPVLQFAEGGACDDRGITLVDRRNGLLLSRLGFLQAWHGTSAVFFG